MSYKFLSSCASFRIDPLTHAKKFEIMEQYKILLSDFFFFSVISERNNDYSDTLDFRRGWVGEVGVVTFVVLKVPD